MAPAMCSLGPSPEIPYRASIPAPLDTALVEYRASQNNRMRTKIELALGQCLIFDLHIQRSLLGLILFTTEAPHVQSVHFITDIISETINSLLDRPVA